MGGVGSGNWYRVDKKATTDECHSLDIFWLRDKSLEGSEDLQPPDVIAVEIAENLQAALEQFAEIHEELTVSTPD